VQIEDELMNRSRAKAGKNSSRAWDSPTPRVESRPATPSRKFSRVAEEEKVDLIILGSRERHGLAILVNFTEDTVLHAAHCDVLAVRLK